MIEWNQTLGATVHCLHCGNSDYMTESMVQSHFLFHCKCRMIMINPNKSRAELLKFIDELVVET